MVRRVALVTGVTGQDGSFLTDLLLSKGYEVHGLIRQATQFTQDKWGHLAGAMRSGGFVVHYGDLRDSSGLRLLVDEVRPSEVYNMAAQSHVGLSFDQPENTCDATAMGPLKLLEAIHRSGIDCKFLQASSSEMFGKVAETPQNEKTVFYPRSPYGCAKVFGHYITQNYRESYGMFACSSIAFNHESERRGENFVTRKITRAVGRIVDGTQDKLTLGSTDTKRDWGYAPEYVEAMWMMLQRSSPMDFVLGTGETNTVQAYLEAAFAHAGLDWKDFVVRDESMSRPSEVDALCADPSLARDVLGWTARTKCDALVKLMVEHDIELAHREQVSRG